MPADFGHLEAITRATARRARRHTGGASAKWPRDDVAPPNDTAPTMHAESELEGLQRKRIRREGFMRMIRVRVLK
jgi:hypothetical protein